MWRLPENLWRGHPCPDPFELLNSHSVQPVLPARILDSPHHHPADENRNLLHPFVSGVIPGDGRRRLWTIFDCARTGGDDRARLAEAPKGRRRAEALKERGRKLPRRVRTERIL